MRRSPLGQKIHLALVTEGPQAAAAVAREAGHFDLFERVNAVASETPEPSFLHSALCAMSLPVRRPADEKAAIIRQDGQYTLAITPKPVLRQIDGQAQFSVLGVPFGSLPRLILIHVMTEAVRTKSREIRLGETFTDWMRRMGFKTVSYGPRGSATLIRQQLDRLLACEWTIRWDGEGTGGEQAFGLKEMKLTQEYTGTDAGNGAFLREIVLTEDFFAHLRRHAVPLNEHAIRQLRDSATALDLYTWLAYRLPRIGGKGTATLGWQQLAVHFGNAGGNLRKFRQTVRDAWERQVSGVYPEARAEFDTTVIRLYASPAPLQRTAVLGARLAVVLTAPTDADGTPGAHSDRHCLPDSDAARATAFLDALRARLGATDFRLWIADSVVEPFEEGWRLLAPTAFKADWIRSRFAVALGHAARHAGLPSDPQVGVRPR